MSRQLSEYEKYLLKEWVRWHDTGYSANRPRTATLDAFRAAAVSWWLREGYTKHGWASFIAGALVGALVVGALT